MTSSDPRYVLFVLAVAGAISFVKRPAARVAGIAVISCAFYATLGSWSLPVLLYVATTTYMGGRMLAQSRTSVSVGLPFWIGLVLLPLLIAKYWSVALRAVGLASVTSEAFLLPIGLSFYTFQAIGYLIDVHVGRVEAEPRFHRFLGFLAFFPQLTAGPIERAPHLLPQLDRIGVFDEQNVRHGLRLILWGLVLKSVVADSLAPLVERVYSNPYGYGGGDVALATLYFSIQVYADFAGYTAIAIGSGRVLGVELLPNFMQPYLSESLPEFWRRWHMSLSGWFRDYVFTPLHFQWRTWGGAGVLAALVVTFTLIGIWHGSAPKYALFGAVHGLLVGAATLTAKRRDRWRRQLGLTGNAFTLLRIMTTFVIVAATFVLFRARDVHGALAMYRAMVTSAWHPSVLPWHWPLALTLLVVAGDLAAAARFQFASLPRYVRVGAYHAATVAILAALIGRFLAGAPSIEYYIYYRF